MTKPREITSSAEGSQGWMLRPTVGGLKCVEHDIVLADVANGKLCSNLKDSPVVVNLVVVGTGFVQDYW